MTYVLLLVAQTALYSSENAANAIADEAFDYVERPDVNKEMIEFFRSRLKMRIERKTKKKKSINSMDKRRNPCVSVSNAPGSVNYQRNSATAAKMRMY